MPTADAPLSRTSPGEAPVRDRRDACPGALRLHAADDGALARVRLPAGVLTTVQARTLAGIAQQLGDGALHLTSRGNVQLRGLDDGCGAELAERLTGAGLLPSPAHERIRNIVASPLSGLDGRGHAEVVPWARELDGLLCADPATAGLSGRFLFAFDDGRGDVAALGADVTAVADPPSSEPRTRDTDSTATVYVGDRAAVTVPSSDAPRTALLAAESFLDLSGREGSRVWRVRELLDGGAALERDLRAHMTHLTSGGATPPSASGHAAPTAPRAPGPEQGGGVFLSQSLRQEETTRPGAGPEPGQVGGADGRIALSVAAPLGSLTVTQWRLLATTAEADGTGEIRLTPWRGVVVPGLRADAAPARLSALHEAGLVTSAESPWYGVGACTGRPGCAKSLADVRADAREAVRRGGRSGLPVYWSGCERRCGRPKGTHVDVLAGDEGYEVSVAGADGHGTSPAAAELPAAITAAAVTTTVKR